jgi:hypothetical protein
MDTEANSGQVVRLVFRMIGTTLLGSREDVRLHRSRPIPYP